MRADLTRRMHAAWNRPLAIEEGAEEEMRSETIIGIAPDIEMYIETVLVAVERCNCDGDTLMHLCLRDGEHADQLLQCTLLW